MQPATRCHAAGFLALALLGAACPGLSTSTTPQDGGTSMGDAGPGGTPPVDILFVVDNSGSMAEEQAALQEVIAGQCAPGGDCAGRCDTPQEVEALRAFMAHEDVRGLPPERWESVAGTQGAEFAATWSGCHFLERLLAAGVDFQIGVITTDDGEQDNVGGPFCVPPDSGRTGGVFQRGCLQGRWNVDEPRLVRSSDGDVAFLSRKLREIISNVGTCGSGFEEGLDSIRAFLDPAVTPADASCDAERSAFLRHASAASPEPRLVVVILSDENDCTHYDREDGINETRMAETSRCYSDADELRPVSEFVGFLQGLKPSPSLLNIAAIVAGTRDNDGSFVSGDCRCNGSAPGAYPILQCTPAHGASISVVECGEPVANAYCGQLPFHEDPAGGPTAQDCCTGDRADRYVGLALGPGNGPAFLDSICGHTYEKVLAELANHLTR
ncbi:MAG: hypothetical protein AB2A00_11660 [Myxococcota bacterium]